MLFFGINWLVFSVLGFSFSVVGNSLIHILYKLIRLFEGYFSKYPYLTNQLTLVCTVVLCIFNSFPIFVGEIAIIIFSLHEFANCKAIVFFIDVNHLHC